MLLSSNKQLGPRALLEWYRVRQDFIARTEPRHAAPNLAHNAAGCDSQCHGGHAADIPPPVPNDFAPVGNPRRVALDHHLIGRYRGRRREFQRSHRTPVLRNASGSHLLASLSVPRSAITLARTAVRCGSWDRKARAYTPLHTHAAGVYPAGRERYPPAPGLRTDLASSAAPIGPCPRPGD